MLTQESKNHFIKILNQEEMSYSDSFNSDILNILSLECNEGESIFDDFFASFTILTEIEKWIDLVKSKIVMHEHEDGIDNIIYEYVHLQRTDPNSLGLN